MPQPLSNCEPTSCDPPASFAVTSEADRVPVGTKLIYGIAGMSKIFLLQLPKNLATPILVSTLKISPSLVGISMLIFRLYDAFIHPLFGWLSDNTRTRWGRRRPYIFFGSILTGVAFPLMWLFKAGWGPAQVLGWFIGSGLLLYTVGNVFSTPYEAVNLELTPDYHERTSVSAYKQFFQNIAVIVVYWAWYLVQLPLFSHAFTGATGPLAGAQTLSLLVALVMVVLGVLTAIIIRERFYKATTGQPKLPLLAGLRSTFRNRAFGRLTLLTMGFGSAYYLSMGMAYYLRLYYVTGGDQVFAAKIQGVEGTLNMILGIAAIPLFSFLSKRLGKTRTMMIALGLTLVSFCSVWWTFRPDHPWLSVTCICLLAPALTGCWLMVPSMNADICDDDELLTGYRREGSFAALLSWIGSMSFTLGLSIAGPVVELCGFRIGLGAHQTAATVFAIRLITTSAPVALVAFAMIVLRGYPLSSARMSEIRSQLEARRGKL